MIDILVTEQMAKNKKQWFKIHILSIPRDRFWQHFFDLFILRKLFEDILLTFVLRAHLLVLNGTSKDLWHILGNQVFVQFVAVVSLVFKKHSSLIFNCSVAKIDIHKARDDHKHDEESTNKHMDLILFLQ